MDDTKTPEQWAFATGQFTIGPKPRRLKQLSWQHNVASVVHGWPQHKHNAQSEIQLTKEDYIAAINAIEKQLADGTIVPHDGALSSYMKKTPTPAPTKAAESKPAKKRVVRKRKSAPKKTPKKDD